MPASELSAGDHRLHVQVGERTRRYLLHLPSLEEPDAGWPVVMVFHGGGSNPDQMVDFTGMSALADRRGFAVVYPAGTGIIDTALTWNAGNCCGRAKRENVDELAFISALLDDLARRLPIDQSRIYATGMSNGAMMSYLLADRMSERIAAIGPVGGPMGFATCAPRQPVPVMHFHGTQDEFAPYLGGIGRRSISKTRFYSVEHTIVEWVRANRCDEMPTVEEIPPAIDDGTRVTRFRYEPQAGGAEVILYRIDGMGHTWPGRESRFKALGRTTKNLDASAAMWEFFRRHRRAGKK